LVIALITLTARVGFAQTTQGGWIENVESDGTRLRLSKRLTGKKGFIPAARDPSRPFFLFPAPYNTIGVRLTDENDCPTNSAQKDCISPVGSSFWRNTNNHVIDFDPQNPSTMMIFLGVSGQATLFRFHKGTRTVTKLGLVLDDAAKTELGGGPQNGREWYFSATLPKILYVFDTSTTTSKKLYRFDVIDKILEPVFDIGDFTDISSTFGNDKVLTRFVSSNDDKVHTAILQCQMPDCSDGTNGVLPGDEGTNMGCLVYNENKKNTAQSPFSYFPREPADKALHACGIDKGGRWLIISENVFDVGDIKHGDTRIIDLETGHPSQLPFAAQPFGAIAHGDSGFGYLASTTNETDSSVPPGSVRRIKLDQDPIIDGPIVYHDKNDPGAAGHISHSNAKPETEISRERQHACASNVVHANLFAQPRSDEIVCFRLDETGDVLVVAPVMASEQAPGGGTDTLNKFPQGNLDITGKYLFWTANLFGDRLDAFLVEVPSELLVGGSAPGPVALPWTDQHIGTPPQGLSESASQANGTVTMTGAGSGIGGTADSLRFVYQTLTGDGEIIAQVGSLTQNRLDGSGISQDGFEKAGIMIRENTNANAKFAFIGLTRS
jgi:hypothetical protein